MEFVRKAIALSHTFIILIVVAIAFTCHNEWQEVEALEVGNRHIDEFRKEVNRIHIQLIEFSLLGETALDWDETDLENYHAQRIALDSTLCLFNETHVIGRIDSVRSLLEDKERQMFQIVRLIDEQQSINKKIASQVPLIVQTSMQEQPKKPKRKGFLGIFGKKEETKPPTTTTTLRSPNRSMVSEQKEQSRRLSEQADSLAARNADLNRQLKGLICQIENKVQADLQGREDEIVAMRGKSFMQVGGLMGFVLLLLVISYIIIHHEFSVDSLYPTLKKIRHSIGHDHPYLVRICIDSLISCQDQIIMIHISFIFRSHFMASPLPAYPQFLLPCGSIPQAAEALPYH